MFLSDKATTELKLILKKELGDKVRGFTDENYDRLGKQLLEIGAVIIKRQLDKLNSN